MPTDILSHFRGTPRSGQADVLTKIQKEWDNYEVFIVNAPTAFGKTRVIDCVASWRAANGGSATTIVPTNMLVSQTKRECPDYEVMPYKHACRDWPRTKARVLAAPKKLANYMSYMANRMYSECLIVDEAHGIISTLQEFDGMMWYQDKHLYPKGVATSLELMMWLSELPDEVKLSPKKTWKPKKDLKKLKRSEADFILKHETVEWGRYKKVRDRLCVVPLTARHLPPVFWPPARVKKKVFLSATFDKEDLYDLGLDSQRVCYIEAASPIPAQARPIIYSPLASLTYRAWEKDSSAMDKVASMIEQQLEKWPNDKGLIHVTYSVAAKIKAHPRLRQNKRLMFHTQANKERVYKEWTTSSRTEGKALIACGLTEGIDVKGELGRWQIVGKMAYPSLTEDAIAKKMKHRPRWYYWSAVKTFLQSCGRICRGPEDYGETIVIDSEFGKLYNGHQSLFPSWFRQALRL